jgi:hypothetical protein
MVPKMLAEHQNIRRNVSSSDFLQELKMTKTSSSVSFTEPRCFGTTQKAYVTADNGNVLIQTHQHSKRRACQVESENNGLFLSHNSKEFFIQSMFLRVRLWTRHSIWTSETDIPQEEVKSLARSVNVFNANTLSENGFLLPSSTSLTWLLI